MSFFDALKKKAADLAGGHEEKISGGLDKLGELIDTKTNQEHSEKIDTGVGKAKDFLQDLTGETGGEKSGPTPPPA